MFGFFLAQILMTVQLDGDYCSKFLNQVNSAIFRLCAYNGGAIQQQRTTIANNE